MALNQGVVNLFSGGVIHVDLSATLIIFGLVNLAKLNYTHHPT